MKKYIKRDQSGVAHILFVVLAIVVVGAIALIALKVVNNNKSSNNSIATGGTSNSTTTGKSCASTYNDSTLCKFAGNSQDLDKTAYTATIKNTQSGTTSNLTLKHDARGNTALTGSQNGATINSIELNGTTYVKTGSSTTWISYAGSSNSSTTGVSDPTNNLNIAVGASGLKFTSLGSESCGSLTCYKYKITDNSSPSVTQYVWFDNQDYKLRQWKYTDGTNSTDMSVSYGAVSISKPSPVRAL